MVVKSFVFKGHDELVKINQEIEQWLKLAKLEMTDIVCNFSNTENSGIIRVRAIESIKEIKTLKEMSEAFGMTQKAIKEIVLGGRK